jgi:hypothetical protein
MCFAQLERRAGLEPASSVWKTVALPLSYGRSPGEIRTPIAQGLSLPSLPVGLPGLEVVVGRDGICTITAKAGVLQTLGLTHAQPTLTGRAFTRQRVSRYRNREHNAGRSPASGGWRARCSNCLENSAPETVRVRFLHPPPFQDSEPARWPGSPAKRIAPQGVGIVPSAVRHFLVLLLAPTAERPPRKVKVAGSNPCREHHSLQPPSFTRRGLWILRAVDKGRPRLRSHFRRSRRRSGLR